MKKYIIANWKMNPNTLAEAKELYHFSCDTCQAIGSSNNDIETIVMAPSVYLESLSSITSDVKLGAQNCHWEDKGPFTGEISSVMLKNLGIKYVLIGHSERRWKMGEDDGVINEKMKAVLKNDLIPILAVGEVGRNGDRNQILSNQLNKDLAGLDEDEKKKIIIAYEPVWAIGTGDSDTPEDANSAAQEIKVIGEKVPVLYGGSVNSENVKSFMDQDKISGVLVGGASIDKDEFKKIIEIINA